MLLGEGVSDALFGSAVVWALYLALEPYVRRRWSTSLIAWSRVLTGKIADPLVGRDLLIGIVFGLCFTLLEKLSILTLFNPVSDVQLDGLLGVRFGVGRLFDATGGAVMVALAITFLLTLLRALLRRDWLAAAVPVLVFGLVAFLGATPQYAAFAVMALSLMALAFIRFGLLALSGALLVFFPLNNLPFTTNLSAWYAGTSFFVMFLVTALAGYAFYTSLGGQKVFKGKLLEE